MSSVLTILAEGFEETEAVTVIDLLRRAGIGVTICGLNSSIVKGSHGIQISTDILLGDFRDSCDGIVLPGGQPGSTNLAASPLVLEQVRQYHTKGLLCAAICAAPTVLAKADILEGYRVTCYPGMESRLKDALFQDNTVVRDRNVITSRGLGTAIAFSLEIIAYLCGREKAVKIGSSVLFQ
jgi:4-methyl-5(b-hydroxyethyl)-thiazole monophosphate biosynthesis